MPELLPCALDLSTAEEGNDDDDNEDFSALCDYPELMVTLRRAFGSSSDEDQDRSGASSEGHSDAGSVALSI